MAAVRKWALSLLLLPAMAFAQADSLPPSFEPPAHRLTVDVSGFFDSNALGNDLVMGLLQGGELTMDIRQRTAEALGASNRAGYGLLGSITYSWKNRLFGSGRWNPRLSLAYQSVLGLRFAEDVYSLAFFGNKAFEGKTAAMGTSVYGQYSYQRVGAGIADRETGSYVEIGLITGSRGQRATIQRADLYTAPAGEYLELELDGRYESSDTAASALLPGLGAAISFNWARSVQLLGHPATLSLGATDVGFIAWNGRSLGMDKDTLIRFDGFALPGMLDMEGLILDEQNLQDSLGLQYGQKAFTTLLPALFHAKLGFGRSRYDRNGQRRHAYNLSVDQRLLPGYGPYISLVREVRLLRALYAQAGVAHGGYGGFRIGLGVQAELGDHIALSLASTNMVGLLAPKARGKALAVGLEFVW